MHVKSEALFKLSMGICVFSVILLIGNLAQGAPAQKETYMRVRCRPNSSSANCIEEKVDISQGEVKEVLTPATDPLMIKSLVEKLNPFLSSGEESGSGNDVASGTEPDLGSGMDSSLDYSDTFAETIQKQPSQNYGLNLNEEDFIL